MNELERFLRAVESHFSTDGRTNVTPVYLRRRDDGCLRGHCHYGVAWNRDGKREGILWRSPEDVTAQQAADHLILDIAAPGAQAVVNPMTMRPCA